MLNDQYLGLALAMIGGFLAGVALLLILLPKRRKMPKKETYADFICGSLVDEPHAWVTNEFRALNTARNINLWAANGAEFIRDESRPSGFTYWEKRRIWKALKENSRLRAMLPKQVEAAESGTEDADPPKPIPYASAIGSRPEAPWVTREEWCETEQCNAGLRDWQKHVFRELEKRVAAIEAAARHLEPK